MQCEYIKIKPNMTLGALAVLYSTSVEAILTANPTLIPTNLVVGQKICIPTDHLKVSSCPIGSIPYQIKQGDTLSNIATEFGTTDEAILLINPKLNPKKLEVGAEICIQDIRPKVVNCPSLNIYVVQPGDAPYIIAQKFGITLEELVMVNPNLDPFNLKIDQIICLPLTPTPYIIVIDLLEKKLSLFFLGKLAQTYPVAIGKPTTPTPIGNFYIFNKQVNPGGPFGTRWLGLSQPSYGIHGTNRPDSIGTAVSNGCIRMYNQDVEDLFSKISIYTPVIIH